MYNGWGTKRLFHIVYNTYIVPHQFSQNFSPLYNSVLVCLGSAGKRGSAHNFVLKISKTDIPYEIFLEKSSYMETRFQKSPEREQNYQKSTNYYQTRPKGLSIVQKVP